MNVVLIGATSAIVHSLARLYAADGSTLTLVARNAEKLRDVSQDLRARGAQDVKELVFDLADSNEVDRCVSALKQHESPIDVLVIGHGVLPNQEESGNDFLSFQQQFQVNFLSAAAMLIGLKSVFIEQGKGQIVVIGSVAGDRGRQSNYAYGTAKGALEIFLSGLRNELCSKNVSVLCVKPGFVDTPMTSDIKKGPLFAQADTVAKNIRKAIDGKKEVVYAPGFWRLIMVVIKNIPERVFKRLSL